MKTTLSLLLLFCAGSVCPAADTSSRRLPRSSPEKQGISSSAILAFIEAADQPVAASGAWTRNDTFTLKLCLYETPFYTTMIFRFNGDQLLLDSEHNVSFGTTTLPQLVGEARQAK